MGRNFSLVGSDPVSGAATSAPDGYTTIDRLTGLTLVALGGFWGPLTEYWPQPYQVVEYDFVGLYNEAKK